MRKIHLNGGVKDKRVAQGHREQLTGVVPVPDKITSGKGTSCAKVQERDKHSLLGSGTENHSVWLGSCSSGSKFLS